MRYLGGVWVVLGAMSMMTVACGGELDDGDTAAGPGQVTQALTPSGLPPVNSLPTPQTVNEDSPLFFSGLAGNAITVSDGDNLTSTVQIIVTNGVFFAEVTTGVTIGGNGTFSVTLSGEINGANGGINKALNGSRYVPSANYNGPSTLQMNSSDNNGEADFDVLNITVTAFNDPPVNNAPTSVQGTTEDVPAAFNLSVTDVDVAGAPMAITLTASNSTLITLPTLVGLSFSSGDGSADASMTFTGTLPSINTALNGLVITPPLNFIGPSTLQITSFDQGATGNGDPGADNDTVNINWAAVNDPPVNTVPAAQTIVEESSLTFSSGAGNRLSLIDVDATTALVQVTLTASTGTITLGSPGLVTFTAGDGTADQGMTFSATLTNLNTALNNTAYSPGANFSGTATVTMTSNDLGNSGSGSAGSDVDAVTVNVTGVNDAPVNTVPGAQVTNEDVAREFSTGNGNAIAVADVDAPSLQVTLTAANGSVTLGSTAGLSFQAGDGTADATVTFTGTVTSINGALNGTQYIPTPNANGAGSLTVTTSDLGATGGGGALTDQDTIGITIVSVNDAPDAVNDAVTVNEDAPTTNVPVLANDNFVPDVGETLTVTAVSVPLHGTAAISGGTVVQYTPAANYNGPDAVTYTISDGNGGTDSATLTITVNSVNDLPVANADSFTVTENTTANAFAVRDNDSSAPDLGETLTITASSAPLHGTATITGTGANTAISYTPATNYNGPDSFTYTISDGNGGSATATVSVTVTSVDIQPGAVNDVLSVAEDGSGTVDVLANDTGLGDTPITLAIIAPLSAHGTVQIQSDGRTVLYTPAANYSGADEINYRITDSDGDVANAKVSVTVLVGDDLPVAVPDVVTIVEDNSVVLTVLGNDTGLFDPPLVVTVVEEPASGTVTIAMNNTASYVPDPNAFGVDTFKYRVTDGDGDFSQATVTVTVSGVNDAPVAVDDTASTRVDMPITIDVKANDSDPDLNPLTVTAVTVPTSGTATISATGKIDYVPAAGTVPHTATFDYTISDGQGQVDVAKVTVGVGLDSDGDGLLDADEVSIHGTDPANPDSDSDFISDGVEVNTTLTNPADDDSDDDGFLDGNEDRNDDGVVGADETDPNDADSDADGVQDGTELGLDAAQGDDTAPTFVPDADPETTTDPTVADTDGGGNPDGEEDANHNGRVDSGETDPNDAADDPGPPDTDVDGVPNATDNCMSAYNPDQADDDADGIGNTCDTAEEDGCGCRVGARPAGQNGAAALLLLGLAAVVGGARRRGRARRG